MFEAFVVLHDRKPVGVLGVWPDRAFDAKFLSAGHESKVLQALIASEAQVTQGMELSLIGDGLFLVRVPSTDRDTVFSLFDWLLTSPSGVNFTRSLLEAAEHSGAASALTVMKPHG